MHQEPQALYQVVALAIVIESSLAIAQEWPNPLFQYCMHLLKRINEAHQPAKIRGAFVGYGTVDTMPSPILCKRFFSENTMVFKEVFDQPMHFGIGMTNSGGLRGMAALEGLVAALELFDDLHRLQNTRICGSFILHIAASAPDNSLRPEWNDSESMDNMTWDLLPAELKKRSIAYNLLTLKPPKGRLAELYAATNTRTDTPPLWFDLRPSYVLSAAPIASLQPVKVNRRQNEVPTATEQPQENKRPRFVAQEPPKAVPKSVQPPSEPPHPPQLPEANPSIRSQFQSQSSQPLPLSQLQPDAATQPQPAAPPVTQPVAYPSQIPNVPLPPQITLPGNMSQEEVMQRYAAATEMMRKLEATIQASAAAGHIEKADEERAELEQRKPQYEKMKTFVQHVMKLNQQNSAQSSNDGGASQFLPVGGNLPMGNISPSVPSQSVVNSEMYQPQSSLHMNDVHPSMPNPPMNTPMPNMMQTVMEQKQLQHQFSGNVQLLGGPVMKPNPPVSFTAGGNEAVAGMGGMAAGAEPHMMARPTVEWTGTLKWSGQGQNGMREMHCVVTVASALAPEKAHAATWPKTMELMPVDKIPMIQLQEWIKRQQTCLCSFKAMATDSDQASYSVLMQLLDSVCAISSWTVPSGNHPTRNVIFFTYHQRTVSIIAGAVFPLTGIPDSLPKPMPQQMGVPTPQGGPSLPAGMSPNMMQAFNAMSPMEKQQIMATWFIRQNMMRQQQQQAAQLANQQVGLSSFNPNMQLPNQGNLASAFGMMTAPQGNFMMNRNSQNQGPPSNMGVGPLGGGMTMNPAANVSYEALQAMLQRNAGNEMNM